MRTTILVLTMVLLGAHSSFAANKCSTAVESFKWPADNQPADMDDLSKSSKKALALGKLKKTKVETGSVKWKGPVKIKNLYVGQHDILERFSESSLSYHQERGRDPIDVTIWTFMNLGMDHGVDMIFNSPAGEALFQSILALRTTRKVEDAKTSIDYIVKYWSEIENGSALKNQKNPEAKKLIAAAAEVIGSYYQTEKSPAEIRKALGKISPLAYEQGRRVWLDIGRGSHIRNLVSFLERFSSQLDKASREEADRMILNIQEEAGHLIQAWLKTNK